MIRLIFICEREWYIHCDDERESGKICNITSIPIGFIEYYRYNKFVMSHIFTGGYNPFDGRRILEIYDNFNIFPFFYLQMMIRYLYRKKYLAKMSFHPNNLVGKLIKQDLYSLLKFKGII